MERKKWEPRIVNIMADGSRVDDLTKHTIPAGHSYYDIVASIYQKGAQPEVKNMKKLINWIWSSKQAKTIVHCPYRMVDEKARDYNETHGLPLDQLVG